MGLLGSFVTAPEAAREAVANVSWPLRWLRRQAGGLWNRLLRRREGPRKHQVSGTVSVTSTTSANPTVQRPWPQRREDQIQMLKDRADAQQGELDAFWAALHRETGERRAGLAMLRGDQDAAVDNLRETIEQRERHTLRLNARGLPILGAAIVWSGLPDTAITNFWIAVPLLGSSAGVALASLIRLTRTEVLP